MPALNRRGGGAGGARPWVPARPVPVGEYALGSVAWGGMLSTAGDVVFGGGKDGHFVALDAKTGRLLWKAALGGQVNAGAMSYAVNGRQYVAIAAGTALFVFRLFYTSSAADQGTCVDFLGRPIIYKTKNKITREYLTATNQTHTQYA